MQQLRVDQLELAGGDLPLDTSRTAEPASRRRQLRQRAQWRSCDIDLAAVNHPSLRAGGGASAARYCRARHIGREAEAEYRVAAA